MSDSSFAAGEQIESTMISNVHSDVVKTHILTRLDGESLASISCAASEFHALSSDDKLWKDTSVATWPSINTPRVHRLISTLPASYRSFYSDSFPGVDRGSNLSRPTGLLTVTEIISAVDIYYKGKVILSKVQETETETGWFLCTPFRVDLLDPKEYVTTSINLTGKPDKILTQLEENLTLSWVVIDPVGKRSANFSSLKPVSFHRHWCSGDVQARFGSIFAGGAKDSELVQCGILVTCGGEESGELYVREVSMVMEDMDGKVLTGKESLVIFQGVLGSKRRKKGKGGEEKRKFLEFIEMKRERRERNERREKMLDMGCMMFGFTILIAFWYFVLFIR